MAELSNAKAEAVEAAVTTAMARLGIPGVSVAIASGSTLRFAAGYGQADAENGVPAKAVTAYRLASVSKPITAVAVLKLAEEGKLDLDAPIQRYVPSFPEKPFPVTARQLLGHLGGIRHYRDDEPTNTKPYSGIESGLSFFKDDALVAEPGTKYSYSTYGYTLLGAAIEGASGKPYLDYLREAIFARAGMTSIRADEVRSLIPNRAQGYVRTKGGDLFNSGLADVSYKVPGGGLIATATDVARFGAALGAGALLTRESLAAMLTLAAREGRPGDELRPGSRDRPGRQATRGLAYGRAGAREHGRRSSCRTRGLGVAVLINLEGLGRELVTLARRLADVADAPEGTAPTTPKR